MLKKLRNFNLRTKILMSIIPVVLISYILIIIFSYGKMSYVMDRTVINDLRRITDDFYKMSHTFFKLNDTIMKTLSLNISSNEIEKSKISMIVKEYKKKFPQFFKIYVVYNSGNEIITENGIEDNSTAFYKNCMNVVKADKKFLLRKSLFDKKTIVLYFVEKIKDGYVIGEVLWEYFLKKYIDPIKIGETGYAYIVDENGIVIGHPERKYILSLDINKLPFGKKILGVNKEGRIEYTWKGKEKWVFLKVDESSGWRFATGVTKDEVLNELKALRYQGGILIFIFSVVFIVIIVFLGNMIAKPLKEFTQKFIKGGEGDLTQRIEYVSDDEIGVLSQSFNRFMENLSSMIRELKGMILSLRGASDELKESSSDFSRIANEQREQIITISSSIEEMSATARDIAKNAEDAKELSIQSEKVSNEGMEEIEKMKRAMDNILSSLRMLEEVITNLDKSSQKIGEIVVVINEIADQTNLLALNAAIEAARAGEHGRGFAVVADEVRKLAERTGKATKEIEEIILSVQKETKSSISAMKKTKEETYKGKEISDKSTEILGRIVGNAKGLLGINEQIASAIIEMAQTVEDISKNMMIVSDSASQTSEAVESLIRTSEKLLENTKILEHLTENFKV